MRAAHLAQVFNVRFWNDRVGTCPRSAKCHQYPRQQVGFCSQIKLVMASQSEGLGISSIQLPKCFPDVDKAKSSALPPLSFIDHRTFSGVDWQPSRWIH